MTAEDNISTEFNLKDENIDKDQRRLLLLNDASYGIVLCFLEKFRSVLDLPNYSLQRLEDHLINYQERSSIPPRLIDFHFILLKRLSLAKNTQREKFDSIITKFASRFDLNDGEHLSTTGYLQADVNVKIRILKNLLESQFDLNQTFTKTLLDKSAREIKSTPLGRDRFGVSYWLFMDTDCFVRLFREDADIDRTWSYVAKDRDELENFIKLLITDSVVRQKFSDWAIDYEPFSTLSPSNEFEKLYLPPTIDIKEESMEPVLIEDEKPDQPVKKKRGRPKGSGKPLNTGKNQIEVEMKQDEEEEEDEDGEKSDETSSDEEEHDVPTPPKRGRPRGSITSLKKEIKQEVIEEENVEPMSQDDEPMKKKRGRPRGSIKSVTKGKNQMDISVKEEKQEVKPTLNNHETNDVSTKKRLGRPKSSTKQIEVEVKEEEIEQASTTNEKLNESMKKKRGRPRGSINKSLNNSKNQIEPEIKNEPKEEIVTPARRGRKRKIPMEDNSNDENSKIEESNTEDTHASLRRSTRPRKSTTMESNFIVDSKNNSQIKKRRSMNGKVKASNDNSIATNHKSGRSRRRRKATSRRNANNEFCFSSSSSDEHVDYLSDDEYDSEDYLPNPTEAEGDDNFFELDEDNNTTGEELRTAKTAQASTIITACKVCSKSDRPEVLLLCDDCDDAYHVDCLRPPLISVPDGDWFCPLCEHKKLSNHLIEKLKELFINFNTIEQKRIEYLAKKSCTERKTKPKEYTSDESVTASESEHENLENNLNGDESMLSINQTNENSNMSSSQMDDANKNISQRGRHRRTRFDMNKMLNNDDESDDNTDTDENDDDDDDDDDEYVEPAPQITNFDLQIPKKMTRLLNPRNRPLTRMELPRLKPKPIAPRLYPGSTDFNNRQASTIIYSNGDLNTYQMKPIIPNTNQTLKIVRRWNDVQRRNKLRISNMKPMNDTTSDCADENSVFCPDDASPPRSNESHSNSDTKDEDYTIIRSKVTLVQPANLLPMYKSSTKNVVTKNEVNFDRLTRDIQYAVSEANTLSTIPKPIDQQNVKRIQKTNFSPYLTKVSIRPLPVLLPKPAGIGYKIFKSKDPPTSTSSDLSNIILTPSSSSSLLDPNDEQSTSTMNT